MRGHPYEAWEDSLIVAHYQECGPGGFSAILPLRTRHSIKARAGFLKVSQPRAPEWTLVEIGVIRACYPDLKRAARRLPHRTFAAITTKSKELGLARHRRFTAAEKDLITKLYSIHSDAQMATMLGRPLKSVDKVRRAMGLHRPTLVYSALHADVKAEAAVRGVVLSKITNGLGLLTIAKCGTATSREVTLSVIAQAFGGELYAVWED